MGFMTKKRESDLVSVFAIVIVTVLLSFFISWLHYSNKVDKMKSSCETKVQLVKRQMSYLQDKNKKLEDTLTKVKEFVQTNEELVKILEEEK